MLALLALVFFLSGAAGLVFETLWFRQAGLAFGNSFWASSIVLSSYMAGLALGNLGVARLGARVRRPLVAYAVLEVLIAVVGILLVLGLPRLTPVLVEVLRPVLEQPWLANPLRLLAGFALLVIPTTAMGATLPLLVRVLVERDANFGSALGRLYGWNTLGAFVGCLAGELALIEWFGVRGTALVAGSANLVAAAGALFLARHLVPASVERDEFDPARRRRVLPWRALVAAALAGAALLALEVVWFRFLHLYIHAGAVAFALVLSIVLAGIALGGLCAGSWSRRSPGAEGHAAALASAAGICVVATYAGFRLVLPEAPDYERSIGGIVRLGVFLMLPSALLSGVLFTFIGAAAQREIGDETRAAGFVTFANTAGAAAGSLLAGFALLPVLGLEASFLILAAGYGVVALLCAKWSAGRAAPLLGVGLLAALLFFPFGSLRDVYLARVVALHGAPDEVVAVREGRTETSILIRTQFLGRPLHDTLITDAYPMAGTEIHGRRYMRLFVHLPVALRPDPREALLISYGVGTTARALVDTASLQHIDIVDTSREILGLADLIHPDPGQNPLRDPRVSVHVEDGRHFLATTTRRYDLITGEPPPPKASGIESLYSQEYFALVHRRLAERGIATYWIPMHSLGAEDARSILHGFCEVFPDCTLWTAAGNQWMVMGSRGGIARPVEDAFVAQWRDPKNASLLRELGLELPELLGTTFLADARQLVEVIARMPPLVDDFPKRLADGLSTPRGAAVPLTRWGFDAEGARRRFRESRWVRELWPPDLRARTLDRFPLQDIVNKTSTGQWSSIARIASLHRVLRDTRLETLPLWMLGGTADTLRIANAVEGSEDDAPNAMLQRGFGALARRRPAEAAEHFAAAEREDPDDIRSYYWQVYALAASGQIDAARQVAAREPERPAARADAIASFWRTMASAFGVAPLPASAGAAAVDHQ